MREITGHLEEKNNKLYISNHSCSEIASLFGTPTYVYNLNRVRENYHRLRDVLTSCSDRGVKIYYALKANFNPEVLKTLAYEGAYADVLSIYEAEFALAAGFPSHRIMFTGTSVADETMKYMLKKKIKINIDSFSQLRRLAQLAPENLEVSVRWNPGKGEGFDYKVITAGAESHGRPIKFGIQEDKMLELCSEALELGINPVGLHQHIGSGWTGKDVKSFLNTVKATLEMARKMTDSLGFPLKQVDFGGGLGIPYRPEDEEFPVEEYSRGICDEVRKKGLNFDNLCVEPGRYIVGDAGVLLTRVNTVEKKNDSLIVGVDAGFNTLLRPVFYGNYEKQGFKEAYHHIVNADKVKGPRSACTVAGPLCETGDLLAINRGITTPVEGETLAILGAGAYGFSMSSIYNLQPRPAEVVVPGPRLVTRRDNMDSLTYNYI